MKSPIIFLFFIKKVSVAKNLFATLSAFKIVLGEKIRRTPNISDIIPIKRKNNVVITDIAIFSV